MVASHNPQVPFGRVLTAMVTPFDAELEVDLGSVRSIARHLVDTGHDGIVVNGTTGESPTTHGPEKTAIVSAVVHEVGDEAVVVAGACSNDTAHAVRMAIGAEQAGADGLLLVTPYYSRPTQEGIYRHLVAIADATDLPCMLYDIPGRTAVAIADDTLDRLAEHPRIVAVKDATGQPVRAMERARRTGLAFYSGDDALNLAFLAHGAVGVVSVVGHAAGRRWVGLLEALDRGDLSSARDLLAETMPAVHAMMDGGIGAATAKAALELLGVMDNRRMRLPHVEADDEMVDVVRRGLLAAGLLDV